ncbi:MAG: gamma-glutamylcyclotransferase [Chloroflexi bacterium]|uniref:Gamma-glutamylcyclotransferase n=1 Tax=Candidatus Chlorohelix allophototropha TaxID=3003348 RepID=A0A8T7M8W0_9CHLR|nr:gamma-glutamylcyclotransferase [Chloroflexota bacterium]WJW68427.1 gamma-glutamylcyclotransferase [Chloroflexota bacterium L227-S17]
MVEEYLPFFVYGTLRPRDYNYMIFLQKRTEKEETGFTLEGIELYDLGAYPMVREVQDKNKVVTGDLITVPVDIYPDVLANIDMLEDYMPGREDNHYCREIREVKGADGSSRRAWIYMGDEVYFKNLTPSPVLIEHGDWLLWKQSK